ncbi:MAG: hemolysin III family protein [Clostridiales bacterium]|nr:hemolysin III family protein [Clostridiales bacterium]
MTKKHGKLYSLGEEIFNSVSHGTGAALAVAGCVLLIIKAAISKSGAVGIVSAALYGASLVILYTMSTLYHALTNKTAKKVFRIFDHCTIFVLIAGTYTPYTLITLRGWVGYTIFSVLWGVTVLGIVLNAVNLERFRIISMVFYIVMGWCIIFAIRPMLSSLDAKGLILLLAGGIFYTGGLLFYKQKNKYMHSVWHLFVLAGSLCHYFSVMFSVYA